MMPLTLDQYKASNPQYKDIPDQKLADALYDKYYKGKVDRAQFDKQVGLGSESSDDPDLDRARPIIQGRGDADALLATAERGATVGLDAPASGLLGGLASAVTGHGFGSGYKSGVKAEDEEIADYGKRHPFLSATADIGGSLATPLGDLGLIGKGGSFLTKVLRNAVVGAGYGAVSGAANARGDLKEHVTGAVTGAGAGAATAGAIEAIPVPIAQALYRGVRSHMGQAEKVAADTIREHLRLDGLTPVKIDKALAAWRKNGINDPTLLDIAGPNTKGLLRAVSTHFGPARTAVEHRANQAREALPTRATEQGRNLPPAEQRPAHQVLTHMRKNLRTQAEKDFREPYQTPVTITTKITDELEDREGMAAIRHATAEARSQKRYDQVRELTTLAHALDAPLPKSMRTGKPDVDGRLKKQIRDSLLKQMKVSGGALHRVEIALRERGNRAANRQGMVGYGAGLTDRAHNLGAELDQVPGLRPARDAYREQSRQMEALGEASKEGHGEWRPGFDVFTGKDGFRDEVSKLSPGQLRAAQVGARQQIIDKLYTTSRQDLAALNQVVDNPSVRENLTALFGKDKAARFIGAAENLRTRLKNAQDVAPSVGSKTTPTSEDIASLSSLLHPTRILRHVLSNLDKASGTRSQSERAAIARYLINRNPSQVLQKVFRAGERPRPSIGRRTGPAAGVLAGQAMAPQDGP